jgi:hypothetical protein
MKSQNAKCKVQKSKLSVHADGDGTSNIPI